jgi:D-threo-aldose 1-dehydrogenase
MDPRTKRRIGTTGLEVTVFGFGAAPIGGFRATIPEAQATATVEAAVAEGVGFFDTSPFYGYGRSELRLGAVLRGVPRDSYVLSTKIGRVMRPMKQGERIEGLRPNGLPFAPRFDYTYDGVMRSLEHSYLRLGLNRIDIVFIHDVDLWSLNDPAMVDRHFAEVMDGGYRALDALRRDGTIGAIGCGLNDSGMCARFAAAGDFDCMLLAGRYTLLEQGALADFMPIAERKNISVVIGGPYNSGILTGNVGADSKYDYAAAPAPIIEKARRLETVCARHGVPLPTAAIQFPLAHPAVAAVIPGALSPAEVEANARHLRAAIPAALWDELRHEGLIDPAAPVPGVAA